MQAGFLRRAAVFHREHDYAAFLRQIIEAHEPPMYGNGLRHHTDVAAPDSPIPQETAGDEFRRVNPNSETESLSR